MTSLSGRFGQIKAVIVDSTESETDFSDDSLFPNTFNYSNTPTLSFTSKFKSKTAKGTHVEDEEDSDDEVFEMESNWREHFQKILLKSINLNGRHEKHECLSGNVPEINNRLPLQCLKNSIEKYNRINQLSDDVGNNFVVNNDLILDRNENEFDTCLCDVSTSVEKSNKSDDIQIDTDNDNKAHSVDLDNAYTDKIGITTNLIESTIKGITDNAMAYAMHETNEDTLNYLVDFDTSIVENDNGLNLKLDNNSKIKAKDELFTNNIKINAENELSIPLVQETVSKIKQNFHEIENCDSKNQIDKHSDGIESSQKVVGKVSNCIVQEPLQSLLDNKEIGSNVILRENQKRETNENNRIEPEFKKEEYDATHDHEESFAKESSFIHENNTELSVDKGKICKSLKEAKSQEKESDSAACDTLVPKRDEKKNQTSRSVSQVEIKRQILPDKKSSLVSKSKKVPLKLKTSKVEQTFSFPLDELLPPLQRESQNVSKGITEETMSVHRKTTNEKTKDISSAEIISNPKASNLFNGADVFHGTVYDISPNDESPSETYQHSKMAKPNFSGANTHDKELDTGVENLIAALQSGDQEVIKLFQAALNDQIGSNLKALASRAKSGDIVAPLSEREKNPSFGFYKEIMNSNRNGPDEAGNNPTNEKYDDLLDLLVEQCSALVQTEEDSSKLKYLVKFLQNESEMKLKSKGFTPSPQVEDRFNQPDESLSSYENVQTKTDLHCKLETDLFEGRTLLKGGVEPRHIPKTTVRKPGQERPKDPRVGKLLENRDTQVKLPLPAFAVDLYGEKKVKRILHLDWDAQFSVNLSTSVNEKDPRIKRKSPIDSQVMLIDEEKKSSFESLQLSKETLANKNIHENETQSNIGDSSDVNLEPSQNFLLKTGSSNKKDFTSSKAIPVLITPQKVLDVGKERCVESVERNPVLHCIDLQNSLPAIGKCKHDKKVNVGVVKPLIEKQTSKDTKPSVGIVKPIQMKSTTIKAKTESKGDLTSAICGQSMKTKNSSVNEKSGIKGNKEHQVKILPQGTNQDTDPIVIDSDLEEGDLSMNEKAEACDKNGSKTISESHKNTVGKVKSKFQKGFQKTATEGRQGKVQTTSTVSTNFSDLSSYEDGEIDSLLDKSFKEKKSTQKSSRGEKRLGRSYRKRERSSSRSSVDSRVSYSSYTNDRLEERRHKKTSPRRSKSQEKLRDDRSRSGERTGKKSLTKETSASYHKHKHTHHTRKEDKSYRGYSNTSDSSKRYGNPGNVERKRHKTDEGHQTVESYEIQYEVKEFKDNFKSKVSSACDTTCARRTNEKFRGSETVSYQYNEACLSDEEISKEYQEYFGKRTTKTKRISTGYNTGINLAENEFIFQGKSKTRRKSSEEIQKEVLEDKKFLESCKKKILGNSSIGNKKFVVDENENCVKQLALTVQKTHSASGESTDLEEGEI